MSYTRVRDAVARENGTKPGRLNGSQPDPPTWFSDPWQSRVASDLVDGCAAQSPDGMLVGRAGFEPAKAEPSDLQSGPV